MAGVKEFASLDSRPGFCEGRKDIGRSEVADSQLLHDLIARRARVLLRQAKGRCGAAEVGTFSIRPLRGGRASCGDLSCPFLRNALVWALLLAAPAPNAYAYPPPPDSPGYVPPPPFVDPPFWGPVLMEGVWTSTSGSAGFSFEMTSEKFRVLRPGCQWRSWRWIGTSYDNSEDGKIVRKEVTIRVLGKRKNACLDVPLYIYFVYLALPSNDVAEVCLEGRRENEQVLLMHRRSLTN
jgi:hypothetical protein